jgi:serine phosphatase RsbU (regulator of sigma subunit)
MFATVFFGLLQPSQATLTYINGGHEPPILTNSQGLRRLQRTGPALGMFPEQQFQARSVQLQPKDLLLAYTDGVYDALNPELQEFGEERLLNLVKSHNSTANELLSLLRADLRAHISSANQYDDITLLAMRRQD